MSKRKVLKRAVKSRVVSNKESSDSDINSSDNESPNSSLKLLEILLSLQKTSKRKKLKRRVPKCKHCKDGNIGSFHSNDSSSCASFKKRPPKKNNNSRRPKASTSTINLESDEEKVNESIGDSHLKNIENRIDNFFKSGNLESDDDEDNVKTEFKNEANQDLKKPKDFYMVISDSEEETGTEKPSTSTDGKISGCSDLDNISRGNSVVDKNKDELMDLVDSILVPEEDQLQKNSKPDESWEDYKKKTEEMLGNVSVLIHGLKEDSNKVENHVTSEMDSPKEATPSCPICLETSGEREAAVTICGHIFCKICITQVAKTTKKCPTCRKSLNVKKIHPVYF